MRKELNTTDIPITIRNTKDGFDTVQHDYNSIDFWNNYDGTKSPLNGAAATGPVYWVA